MNNKIQPHYNNNSEVFPAESAKPEANIKESLHSRQNSRYLFNGSIFLLIALLICGLFVLPVSADNKADQPEVYLLLVDKLTINDIDAVTTPVMYRMASQGAVGLASNRTLRGHNTVDCSLTIGAGNLGRGYLNGIMAYNLDEKVPYRDQTASQYYKNLTGLNGSGSSCLMINLPEILTGMVEESVKTVPGAMGEILRQNHYKVCVLGNGDTGLLMSRAGVSVAMDAKGRVPLGDVGTATYRSNPDSYLGYTTNYAYLEKQFKAFSSKADLTVIELSDLARMETSDTAFARITEKERKQRLKEIDTMAGFIVQKMNPEKDLLLLAGVSPSQAAIDLKDNFTPVIAYGKDFPAGKLSSATSRRDYVVANTDIAPTILKAFGLEDKEGVMIGQAMQSTPLSEGNSLQEARDFDAAASMVNRLRTPVIKGYVILQIIIILLSLIVIFWVRHGARFFRPLIISMVVVPLVLLPLTAIQMPFDWVYVVAAVFATAIITAAILRLFKGDGYKSFLLISLLTLLAINLDLVSGTSLIQSSVLGYDPMAGARYYGIGNEYMGVLIGSSIAVASALYQKYQKPLILGAIALVFLLQCYLIAGPSLGANSDGMLTAPAAFLLTLLLLQGVKIRPKVILGILGIIAIIVTGATYYDMSRPLELQTHIGRAANQIMAGGWQEMFLIISRKLGMNLKLIRYTIWSYVFIVMLLVLSLLVYRPVGAMGQLRQKYPYISKGFAGIITGAIVALLINDSGIVAASTVSIYLVVPLLLMMLNIEIKEEEEKEMNK